MKVHNKSAKEVLIEVERLENKRDKQPKRCNCDTEDKLETEAYKLMKAFIENIHPGLVAFKEHKLWKRNG